MHYGYGRIIIKGNELKYQYITIPSGKIADEWTIIKNDWISKYIYYFYLFDKNLLSKI